ncbi:hypothetical protein IQ07DRAFT_646365 [Pyrenochaeta sp. DS3sAY3a]|nr:hypothetical protein IQ07DRAFT_646365 [Pyrenochaeta sp. DS3sAY3a]
MPDSLPPFDPTVYYRFANVKYTTVTLSTGFKDSSPNLTFTPAGSRSSENWQLYFQAGRYLIRNYDYGASAQLGLSDSARSVPALLAPPSGALGQQWLLDQYEDGSWRVSNGLVGNASVLGVSDALVTTEIWPAMMPSPDGSDRWIVTVNLSAGKVGKGMLSDVEGLEPLPNPAPKLPLSTSALKQSPQATASSTPLLSQEVSQGHRVHTPMKHFTCTTAGAFVGMAVLILLFVAANLAWRRRERVPYQLVSSSDTAVDEK